MITMRSQFRWYMQRYFHLFQFFQLISRVHKLVSPYR